jgi:hypothetical protein
MAAPVRVLLAAWLWWLTNRALCAELQTCARMDGPTIVVKVIKGEKVRTNVRGEAPDPMVKLRINLGP